MCCVLRVGRIARLQLPPSRFLSQVGFIVMRICSGLLVALL
jgi:hypothetical protein